jgi:hypothetical protein
MTIEEIKDLEDKICDLVSSAKFFNKQTIEMNRLYDKHKNDLKRNLFTIHSNIYFRYVLSVFRTLFEGVPNPQEQSFCFWRKKQKKPKEEEIGEFKKILDLYKQSNLKTFRDKVIDHRDNKNAGDVLANFLNPVKEEFTLISGDIISMLENHIKKYFIEPEYNFCPFYDQEMKKFLCILDREYDRSNS